LWSLLKFVRNRGALLTEYLAGSDEGQTVCGVGSYIANKLALSSTDTPKKKAKDAVYPHNI
jgi:hypothetical protein